MRSLTSGSQLSSSGLAGLRTHQGVNRTVERSTWQVAMRSFPPKLWSFGNPGGINFGDKSAGDTRAYRSVPSMWTRDVSFRDAGLWPVGDANVMRRYIDSLLNEINQALYGGQGLPRMEAVRAGAAGGTPLVAEIPVSGLDAATVERLRTAAQRGSVALGQQVQALVQSGAASTPASNAARGRVAAQGDLAGRAIQAAGSAAATVMAAAAATGQSDANKAGQVLQGLSTGMLAVAPAIPFGIGYAVAGVFQIASWVAANWDKLEEPAEFVGYSTYWSDGNLRNVLRYRTLIDTCASRETLDRIMSMQIQGSVPGGSVKTWLTRTAYGNEGGQNNWTEKKSERAIANAMSLARQLGDPLEDAQLIGQIGTYLRFVGASDTAITMVDHWLWDSRRIERINEGRNSGEINYANSIKSISEIGLWPKYWAEHPYKGTGMSPGLFTRNDLRALHTHIRNQIVRAPVHRFTRLPTFTLSPAQLRAAQARQAGGAGGGGAAPSNNLLVIGGLAAAAGVLYLLTKGSK